MFTFSWIALFALAALSNDGPLPGAARVEAPQSPKQPLAVLYAGCPGTDREKDFVAFLRDHFTKVETTSLETLSMEKAKPFDVVVADWKPRYKYVDGRAKNYDSESGHHFSLSKDFTKPIVMIGAVGGEIARWSKIGWL
jgi:hypothetical protein